MSISAAICNDCRTIPIASGEVSLPGTLHIASGDGASGDTAYRFRDASGDTARPRREPGIASGDTARPRRFRGHCRGRFRGHCTSQTRTRYRFRVSLPGTLHVPDENPAPGDMADGDTATQGTQDIASGDTVASGDTARPRGTLPGTLHVPDENPAPGDMADGDTATQGTQRRRRGRTQRMQHT